MHVCIIEGHPLCLPPLHFPFAATATCYDYANGSFANDYALYIIMLGSVQQPPQFWPTGMYFIEIPVNYQLLICAVAGSLICEGFADELFVDYPHE